MSRRPARSGRARPTPRSRASLARPLVNHVDLCVASLERSLPFYRDLLAMLGLDHESTIEGERGEVVHYLVVAGGAVGLREAVGPGPVDRYATGLHHLAIDAPSRAAVDAVGSWLGEVGATIEGGPGERAYSPGYYAVFFFDPDGLKLEVVHQPQ